MDTAIVILIIVLLFVIGLFAITQLSSSESSANYRSVPAYPAQYSGGGCGR